MCPTVTDVADAAFINAVAGLTYSLTPTGSSAGSAFGFRVLGSTETTQAALGGFKLTLTFTTTTTGAIGMGFVADTTVDYTTTLICISYPDPSEDGD